ncbi:fasciclin domain-containing protein [Seongchinamella sediminis]|uniref:Fasciclin domain-containing protein n=1 Tax=Seongchinamella sediminis TaxID=2283635 RepID=A0A3L7DZK2_9GAMM|nr:fasciclin domain-containing protein [Seongchinamella sediminis]RLQ21282.1 fasciclin domain-containing protein [Seongchinamella sediminis]
MKKVLALAAAMSMGSAAYAGNCKAPDAVSIKDIAAGNPNFSTLVAAAAKAGLVGFLDGNRNLTVFAPTNGAFDTAARAVLEDDEADGLDLVSALDEDTLGVILKYHIAPGERDEADVLDSRRIRMLNRDFTFPSLDGSTAFINDVSILQTDIFACNGVVHVLDGGVLLPDD